MASSNDALAKLRLRKAHGMSAMSGATECSRTCRHDHDGRSSADRRGSSPRRYLRSLSPRRQQRRHSRSPLPHTKSRERSRSPAKLPQRHSKSPSRHKRSRSRSPWRRKTSPHRSRSRHSRSRSCSRERSPRQRQRLFSNSSVGSRDSTDILDPRRMTDIVKHIESGDASLKTVKLLAVLGQMLREKEELKAGHDRHSATASSMPDGSLSAPSTTGHQASYDWPQNTSTSATGGYTNIQRPMQSHYSTQPYTTNWPTMTYDRSVVTGMSAGMNTSSTYTDCTNASSANTSGNAPTTQTYTAAVNTNYPHQGTLYSHNATGYSQQHTIPMLPGRQTPPCKPDLLSPKLTPTQKNLLSDWQMITDSSVRNTDLAPQTQRGRNVSEVIDDLGLSKSNQHDATQVANPYELHVSGMQGDITEDDLRYYFGLFGTLTQITMNTAGCSVVEFESPNHVELAIKAGQSSGEAGMCTHWIKGKALACKSRRPKNCLLISRLKDLTEGQIEQYFSNYGGVTSVGILQRLEHQGLYRYGFVAFDSHLAAETAYKAGLKWEKSEHHINKSWVECFRPVNDGIQQFNPCRLFVKDAHKVADMDIALYYSKYGQIKDIKVANGCGYLEFTMPHHVESAYNDGHTKKSHHCIEQTVIDCKPHVGTVDASSGTNTSSIQQQQVQQVPKSPASSTCNSATKKCGHVLFVGGVTNRGKQELIAYFHKYGLAKFEFLQKKSPNFGNLYFNTVSEAEAAFQAGEPVKGDTKRRHNIGSCHVWLSKKGVVRNPNNEDISERQLVAVGMIPKNTDSIKDHFSQYGFFGGFFGKFDCNFRCPKPYCIIRYGNAIEARAAFNAGVISTHGGQLVSQHNIGHEGDVMFVRIQGGNYEQSGESTSTDVQVDSTTETSRPPKRQRTPSPRRSPSPNRFLNLNLRRSPSPKRRSPSPRRRFLSPRRRSPSAKRSRSPMRQRTQSPRRSLSPKRFLNLNLRRSPSPKRRSPSPRRRFPSPRRRSPSPKRSRSPMRQRTQSPRRSLSPKRFLNLNLRRSPSPKRRSPSPRRRFPSPRRRSPSPKRFLNLNLRRSPSPKRRSPSPRRRFQSPRRRSPSPKRFLNLNLRRSPSPKR
ncbi:uncharacterized protein [Amphiura filiformis]|uniref:uncharacterized protein n=1 Tax=Amphiura filiformis TaxID=82378 RepID=UPI003B20D4C0